MELPFKLDKKKEEELVEKLATLVVDYGMQEPALMALEMFKPVSFISSQLILMYFAPFIGSLGVPGYELSALFSNRENLDLIKKRIEELEKERNAKSMTQNENKQKKRILGFFKKFDRFTKIFRRDKE